MLSANMKINLDLSFSHSLFTMPNELENERKKAKFSATSWFAFVFQTVIHINKIPENNYRFMYVVYVNIV